MKEKKDTRVGLIKLEVFVNIDSLMNGEDALEVDFNYNRTFINENVRELVETFAEKIQDYMTEDEKNDDNSKSI